MSPTIASSPRPPYLAATIASGLVFALYRLRLARSAAALSEAGEYVGAAYTLGIPHRPGNPLFVLVGRASLTPQR